MPNDRPTLVLVGHPAAGKSSCLQELGLDLGQADMDTVFKSGKDPGLEPALDWLVKSRQPVVAAGAHESLFELSEL